MTQPVVRGETAEPVVKGALHQFIGSAEVHHLSEAIGTSEVAIRHVFFQPGARSRPHTHSHDQLLHFTQAGIVAVDGGPDQHIAAGEYVLLPANVVHMHGAADDAPAEHISMMSAIDSDFDAPISEGWRKFREA